MAQIKKNSNAGWKSPAEAKEGKRSNEVNLLKLAAVIMVILIHDRLPGRVGTVIRGTAAMAVPVFYMISGYFSCGSDRKTVQRRAARTCFLLVLANLIYFLWDISVAFLSGNSVGGWLRDACSVKKILVFLLLNESSLRGHLWFLGALLYAYLFLFLMMRAREGHRWEKKDKDTTRWILILSVLLLFINVTGGELLTQCGKDIQIPYIRNWLFCGLPFFGIGYWIHLKEAWIRQKADRKKAVIFFLVSIALNIAEVSYMRQSELYFTTILVSVTAFVLALFYQGSVRSRILILAGKAADRYGLWIYVLQIIVIKNIKWFYAAYGLEDTAILQWLRPALSFFATLFISAIWEWSLGKVISRLFSRHSC